MIMTEALEDREGTASTGGRTITNLRFAGDIDGLAGEADGLYQGWRQTSIYLPVILLNNKNTKPEC